MIWVWLFAAAALVLFYRLVRGPTTGDRLLSVNVLTGMAIMYAVYFSWATKNQFILDIALVVSLLSFAGMIGIVKYIRPKPWEGKE